MSHMSYKKRVIGIFYEFQFDSVGKVFKERLKEYNLDFLSPCKAR